MVRLLKWVKHQCRTHPKSLESPRPKITGHFGWVSNFRSGAAEAKGWGKESMEDRHVTVSCPGSTDTYCISLFDGFQGGHAATFCKEQLSKTLATCLGDFPADYGEVLKSTFLKFDNDFRKWVQDDYIPTRDPSMEKEDIIDGACGTAALLAVMTPETLHVANAGNSRCFLIRAGQAKCLSTDHSMASNSSEKARVSRCKNSSRKPLHLPEKDMLTRMIGWYCLKHGERCRHIVSAEADVQQVKLTNEDEFMVMMSKGIWKNMDIETLTDLVSLGIARGDKLHHIAKEITSTCQEGNVQDDMTIIIVACLGGRSEEDWRSLVKTRVESQKGEGQV